MTKRPLAAAFLLQIVANETQAFPPVSKRFQKVRATWMRHAFTLSTTSSRRGRRRGSGSAHRVVQGVPPPGRTRSRRNVGSIRREHVGTRLAKATRVRELREPRRRYGGLRYGAVIALLPARPAGAWRSLRVRLQRYAIVVNRANFYWVRLSCRRRLPIGMCSSHRPPARA